VSYSFFTREQTLRLKILQTKQFVAKIKEDILIQNRKGSSKESQQATFITESAQAPCFKSYSKQPIPSSSQSTSQTYPSSSQAPDQVHPIRNAVTGLSSLWLENFQNLGKC
jgi:hypothetical protein